MDARLLHDPADFWIFKVVIEIKKSERYLSDKIGKEGGRRYFDILSQSL